MREPPPSRGAGDGGCQGGGGVGGCFDVLGGPGCTSSSSASDGAHLPHVKNWLRTKHAVLFRLSNRTIQVCFQDGSEVLLSSEASACVFTSKGGVRGCHSLGALPQDPELLRRLRYVKEVLHQLVSRA